MTLFGVPLRTPGVADLPLAILTLICGIAVGSLTGSNAILFGFAGGALATACGVSAREHGFRGLLAVLVISIALVAVTAGLYQLIN